jgi:hypothetical protein
MHELTSRLVTLPVPTGKPKISSAHARGSAIADSEVAALPARWLMNDGPTAPFQRIAFWINGTSECRASMSSRSIA